MSEQKEVREILKQENKARQHDLLAGKLNKDAINQNPQGFDYLEGWYVIDVMNRIFGFDGWSGYVKELSVSPAVDAKIGKEQKPGFKQGAYCVYEVEAVFADGTKVIKSAVGFGSSSRQDKVDVEENAIKAAETDAMKRACRYLGNKLGNALYDKQQRGVEK